jgi:hypothetical protein
MEGASRVGGTTQHWKRVLLHMELIGAPTAGYALGWVRAVIVKSIGHVGLRLYLCWEAEEGVEGSDLHCGLVVM